MIRAFALILLGLVLAIFIAPRWQPEERTLSLTLRTTKEIRELVREGARELGARVVRYATDRDEDSAPDVAARPERERRGEPAERLTVMDRVRLDQLVEEKAR